MGGGFSVPSGFEENMEMFGSVSQGFGIIWIIVSLVAAAIFVFVLLMIFSPKLRGKMMSKQVKATRYMAEESKEDIEIISETMADATQDAIRTTVSAVREGITGDIMYCKHCGKPIDRDSRFCKECGAQQ